MEPEQIPSSSQNPITGDHIITKASSKAYRNGYDRIFGKKREQNPPNTEDSEVFETTEELYKSWGYYDWTKEDSLDAPEQSNQISECSQKQTEAEDLCSESSAAVRSRLLD